MQWSPKHGEQGKELNNRYNKNITFPISLKVWNLANKFSKIYLWSSINNNMNINKTQEGYHSNTTEMNRLNVHYI